MKTGRFVLRLFVSGIFTFLFLELTVRIFLFGIDGLNYRELNSFRTIGTADLIRSSSYPDIIYELEPNLDTYFKMSNFKTNSYGIRDKEYTIKKLPNTFRTVVLGDSFTMGSGIDIDDTFHTRLEERLNKESHRISYEFINFGVGGYGPRQYIATLKHKANKFNPDLLLFCLSGPFDNNFCPDKYFQHPYKSKPLSHTYFESFAIKLARKNKLVRYLGRRLKKRIVNNEFSCLDLSEAELVERMEKVFSELKEFSQTNNLSVCVIILRHYYGRTSDQRQIKKTKQMATKCGFYFVDTSVAFKGKRSSEFIINLLDPHPNAKAHRLFSEVIYDYLKEKHLLESEDI